MLRRINYEEQSHCLPGSGRPLGGLRCLVYLLGRQRWAAIPQQGGDYVTGDYNAAENRATVEVKGGVGQIVLKTLSE